VIKAPAALTQVVVRYRPKDLGVQYKINATLVLPDRRDDDALLAHVRNFGFALEESVPSPLVTKFQAARGNLDLTGALDGPTRKAVSDLIPGPLEPGLGPESG